VNSAYKHLDAKLRIAELTIGQWLCVALGGAIAVGWGFYLRPPLGPTLTAVTAVYLGALPAGAALLASFSEFDLFLLVRSAIRWRRREGRFTPGPGSSIHGYLLHTEDQDAPRRPQHRPAPDLDLTTLWED
jgi:hypothetical protein